MNSNIVNKVKIYSDIYYGEITDMYEKKQNDIKVNENIESVVFTYLDRGVNPNKVSSFIGYIKIGYPNIKDLWICQNYGSQKALSIIYKSLDLRSLYVYEHQSAYEGEYIANYNLKIHDNGFITYINAENDSRNFTERELIYYNRYGKNFSTDDEWFLNIFKKLYEYDYKTKNNFFILKYTPNFS